MKTFIYFSLPGYGHINPTLNVARELIKRGHKVIYYSTKRFKPMIEAAGVTFKDYGFEEEFDANISRNIAYFFKVLAQMTEKKIPDYIEEVKQIKPDCIIHDSMAVWGKIIANSIDIPAVALTTSAVFNKKSLLAFPRLYAKLLLRLLLNFSYVSQAYRSYYRTAKRYGVKITDVSDMVISKEKLNIVFSLPTFSPFPGSFGSSFHFVGPSLYPRLDDHNFLQKIPKNKKIIYISYGTVLNDDRKFFDMCMNALKDTDYQVILSLGDRFDPLGFTVPANVIIKKYVNQLEVLKRASVFITHAGMNSCMESLSSGVPMLLIPETEEQRFNALRVQDMGAGIFLKKRHLNEKLIRITVEKLLESDKYREHAQRVSIDMKEMGGYKKATEEILSYLTHN